MAKKSSSEKSVNEIFTEFSKYLGDELAELKDVAKLSEIREKIKGKFESNFIVNENNFNKLLTLIVFSLILLCKEDYIKKDDFKDTRFFISNFFYSIFPILNKKTIENIYNKIDIKDDNLLFENFKENLGLLDQNIWKRILQDSIPEIKIFFWDSLDNETDNYKARDLIGQLKGNYDAKLIPERKNYDLYLNDLNTDLQRQEHKFDLVLLDTIHFSDYKEKGVFEPIHSYLNNASESKLKKIKDIYKEMIGFAYNGNFEAVPLTRNFHLPACSDLYSAKNGLVDFKTKLSIIDLPDLLMQDGVEKMREKWENLAPVKEKVEYISCFTDPDSTSTQAHGFPLITFMGEDTSFLPLQAAKSAHVVYSAFAYLHGGAPAETTSFIKVDKDQNNSSRITLWKEKDLEDPFSDFFKCVYTFVPIISLCADHRIAAKLRYWKDKLWFDPCLPIEAEKFDLPNQSISFGATPAQGCRKGYLSCVGGYCLALLSRSKFKGEATEIAVNLSENYFSSAKKGGAVRREINNRIRFTRDPIQDEKFKEKYIEFRGFEKIARRPSFPGWRIIEDIISNELRLFIATILIYRSIVAEFSTIKVLFDKKNSINQKKLDSFWESCSAFIELESKKKQFTEIIKEKFFNSLNPERYFIQEHLKEKHIFDYLKKIIKIIKKWNESQIDALEPNYPDKSETIREDEELIKANFDCILTDSLYILSLLRFAINSYSEDNHKNKKHEKVIEALSKKMIKNLKGKLKSACLAFGWNFVNVDNDD